MGEGREEDTSIEALNTVIPLLFHLFTTVTSAHQKSYLSTVILILHCCVSASLIFQGHIQSL